MRRLFAAACVTTLLALLVGGVAWHAQRLPPDAGDAALDARLEEHGADVSRIAASSTVLREEDVASTLVVLREGSRLAHETRALQAFAGAGGRVLVLGDPHAAEALGIEIPDAPILAPDGALQANAFGGSVALRDARPLLRLPPDAEPILVTDGSAFVDADGDARPTTGDAAGPFVVGAAISEGRVVVLGSRSAMEDEAFARALLRDLAPAGTRVLVEDGSEAGPLARAAAAAMLHFATTRMGIVLVVLVAAAAACLWPAASRDAPRTPDEPVLPEARP